MRTPELTDHEGSSPELTDLDRLARISSLAARGYLRGIPEGILQPGEDARIVFVRGTYFRREAIARAVSAGGFEEFGLLAEPENPADPFAVAVTADGERIGYLPRELAPSYQALVGTGRCRVAAKGAVRREADGFTIALLISWSN